MRVSDLEQYENITSVFVKIVAFRDTYVSTLYLGTTEATLINARLTLDITVAVITIFGTRQSYVSFLFHFFDL